jgi:SAM-dependent methyltransferase
MLCPLCNSDDSNTVLRFEQYPLYIKPIPENSIDRVPLQPLVIKICNSCGLAYQEITFSDSDLADIYEVVYKSYHSPALSGIGSGLADEFLSFMERNADIAGKNTLEIGCFDGYFLSLLRDRYSCRVTGCDPGPGAEIALKLNVPVIKEYFAPDLFKETFDIVVMRGVLEHIPEPVRFLSEVSRVLEKDGRVAIEVPNVEYSLKNGVIGDFFHEHISYFTTESLTASLVQSGFIPEIVDDHSYYIRILAKKDDRKCSDAYADSVKKIPGMKKMFIGYNKIADDMAKNLHSLLLSNPDKKIYLYGAGGHTVGLLSRTFHFLKPVSVIDGDPAKDGKYVPGFKIPVHSRATLNSIDYPNSLIIVSSKILQEEIVKSLAGEIRKGLRVITLYPAVECTGEEYF